MDKLTYYKILEWLYKNHDSHNSSNEWRKKFVEFLESLITSN